MAPARDSTEGRPAPGALENVRLAGASKFSESFGNGASTSVPPESGQTGGFGAGLAAVVPGGGDFNRSIEGGFRLEVLGAEVSSRQLDWRQRSLDPARVIAVHVGALLRRERRRIGRIVRISFHAVERQRRELVGAGGVQVHLLAEPVGVEQEGPRPRVRQRRQARGIE